MNFFAKIAVQVARTSFVTLACIAQAAEPPVAKERVAALLEYPVADLEVVDSTERINQKAASRGKPLVESSHLFAASDHSCAPLSIAVAAAGTLFTQELRDYYDKALASPVGPQTGFSRITFPDLATGVVGPGVVGPGGYSIVATLTVPSARKDVRVALTVPGDGQLVRIPAAERHYALIFQSTEIVDRLVKCSEIVAQTVASAGKAPKQASTNTPPSSQGTATAPAPLAAVANPSGVDSDRMPIWWLLLPVLGLALVILLLVFRKGRDTDRENEK